jgi:hypothetical protein
MKKLVGTTCLAFAAAAACVAIGPAGQAAADPELNGTYILTVDDTQSTTTGFPIKDPQVRTTKWVVTSCGAGCAHVSMPDRPAMPGAANGGDMHLVNGQWELTQEMSIMHCGAGPDVTTVTSLDAVTLQGTNVNTNHCLDNVITSPASLAPA